MSCILHSMSVYIERADIDKNGLIARVMNESREPMIHWIYLSEVHLATTQFNEIPEYYGPLCCLPPILSSIVLDRRYQVDIKKTMASQLLRVYGKKDVTLRDRLWLMEKCGLF